MAETIIYRDLDTVFKKNPMNDDIIAKTNVNAVKQALTLLLLTNPGEKKFDPLFGCGIMGYLFETPSPAGLALLERKIRTQVAEYEPRVIIESIETNFGENMANYDRNELQIVLYFRVIGINTVDPIKLTFERIK